MGRLAQTLGVTRSTPKRIDVVQNQMQNPSASAMSRQVCKLEKQAVAPTPAPGSIRRKYRKAMCGGGNFNESNSGSRKLHCTEFGQKTQFDLPTCSRWSSQTKSALSASAVVFHNQNGPMQSASSREPRRTSRRLTIRSTGPIAACRHLGYKSLSQIPAHRNGPVNSNVRRRRPNLRDSFTPQQLRCGMLRHRHSHTRKNLCQNHYTN